MRYDVKYSEMTDLFYDIIKKSTANTGEEIATRWLSEFDPDDLFDAERLNVVLPVIKYCVENNKMIDPLKDELFLYYEDYTSGALDDILAEYEASEVISDLVECYKKVFATNSR